MCISKDRFRIQQCCCGCTLRTGSFIIGFFELLAGIAQGIRVAVDDRRYVTDSVFAGQVSGCVITIILSLTLLWGINKNSKMFLLPWLILRGISCGIFAISIVVVFILAFTHAYILLVVCLFLGVALALSLYFWSCIWSFYWELDEQLGTLPPTSMG